MLQQKKLGAQFPKTHKIFLGGVSMEATEEDVRGYFAKYGSVRCLFIDLDRFLHKHN